MSKNSFRPYDDLFMVSHLTWQQICDSIPKFNSEPDWPFWLTAYPDLQKCEMTEQDPEYHGEGNVWIHTQMVVREMIKTDYYKHSDLEQRTILFLAALLHDIAKPITTTIDPKTNRIGHPNHSPLGAIMVRELLWRQNAPFYLREEICHLIHNHQKPFYLMVQKNPLHLIHKLSWEVSLANLMTLARSDIKGRINVNNPESLARLKKLRLFIQKADCLNKPCDFANSITRRNYAYTKEGLDHRTLNINHSFSVVLVIKLPNTQTPKWIFRLPQSKHVIGDNNDLQTRFDVDLHAKDHLMFNEARQLIKQKVNFTWIIEDISKDARQKILTWLYKFNAHIQIVYIEQSVEKRLMSLKDNNRKTESIQPMDDMMSLQWDIPKVWEADSVEYIFD